MDLRTFYSTSKIRYRPPQSKSARVDGYERISQTLDTYQIKNKDYAEQVRGMKEFIESRIREGYANDSTRGEGLIKVPLTNT